MAHEILNNDRVVSTKRAWHRLEHRIPAGLTAREGIAQALPWETELVPVQAVIPDVNGWEGGNVTVTVPDYLAHIRSDDDSVLAIVGKNYQPVPNKVLAEFADSLVGADGTVTVESAGSLRGGKRVFMCAKVGGFNVGERGDHVDSYLTITNTHDGTGAFRAYFSTVRIVCMNTFRYSNSRAGKAGFWFKHTGDVKAKIEEAQQALGFAQKAEEQAARGAEELAAQAVTDPFVRSYFDLVYERTFGKRPEPKQIITQDEQVAIGGGLLDQMLADRDASPAQVLDKAVAEYDEKRGAVIAQWTKNHAGDPAAGTMWGAMNAVTEFHDHQRGRGEIQERKLTDARMHSNLFGTSSLDKQKAMDVAFEIVQG